MYWWVVLTILMHIADMVVFSKQRDWCMRFNICATNNLIFKQKQPHVISLTNHLKAVVPPTGRRVRFFRAYYYVTQRQVQIMTAMRTVWYHNPLCQLTYFALHRKCMESYVLYIYIYIYKLHHDTFTLFTKSNYHLQFLNLKDFVCRQKCFCSFTLIEVSL